MTPNINIAKGVAEGVTAFWGKARPMQDAAIGFHPLLAHSLDVAAVATLLPQARGDAIDPRMVTFLVSLHDIGKFSRPFQAKVPAYWPVAALGPCPERPVTNRPHDAVGATILHKHLAARFVDILPVRQLGRRGWTPMLTSLLWNAIAGHHGRPAADISSPLSREVVCNACLTAAEHFVDAMRDTFQPSPWLLPDDEQAVAHLSWQLAGLTTLADWVGSRQAWFPYVTPSDVADPVRYFWGHALPRAAAALAAAGLAAATPAPFGGIRRLFPGINLPSPIQEWAETVSPPSGPTIAVIEDLTGSGKTEAALTLAHRLMATGHGNGVYFALPTMATANAMFDRLSAAYRRLFMPDSHPSLALAHGRANHNAAFVAAIEGEHRSFPGATDPADDPAEAQCTAWLAEDRRRALLAHVGVGTLDQALLGVLPVRHAPLRLRGLAGKVLIVDEVHAYDPYMRRELVRLVRFQAALGGSVILLSATLPHELRDQLVTAFRAGLDQERVPLTEQAYPLATIGDANGVTEAPCRPREGLARTVTVERLPSVSAAVSRIAAAANAGAGVVWVRNTVDDAIEATRLLRQEGVEPRLFHARFALADRLTIETKVLRRFGQSSMDRAGVLVATQVVEQSLDLDFDLMVTDLAPAELLIQRAGRLWRHKRTGEIRPIDGPTLLVLSPEPVERPTEAWIRSMLPGTSSVYSDHAMLWRSARELFRRGSIVTPSDTRPIIESVFDRNAQDAVPPGLARSDREAYGKGLGEVGLADQNLLAVEDGYRAGDGRWDPDTNTPTRLENRPQVTLRLALLRDGVILPYADGLEPRVAWARSEVSVAADRVASCPIPAGLERAAREARSQWGRWERESDIIQLALLHADGGTRYRLEARTKSDQAIDVWYDSETGLSWT